MYGFRDAWETQLVKDPLEGRFGGALRTRTSPESGVTGGSYGDSEGRVLERLKWSGVVVVVPVRTPHHRRDLPKRGPTDGTYRGLIWSTVVTLGVSSETRAVDPGVSRF